MRSSSRRRRSTVTRPLSPTSPGSASATCSSDPTPKGGRSCPPEALARVASRRSCTSTAPVAPGGCSPMTLPLLVGDPQALPVLARDGTWDRVLAQLRRQVRHAHGRNPGPSAGVIRLLLDQRVTRLVVLAASTAPRSSTASNVCRRGHPGRAGGRAGHRGQRAGSGGRGPGCSPEPATAAPARPPVGRPGAIPAASCRP
jgi:hypothetical protein